jgi:hypothetical protein
VSRLVRVVNRLAAGSTTAARRLAVRLAAWVARGRRTDLTGWRAGLGCWARLAALLFGLYLLWRLVRAVPNLLWLLSTVWVVASWRTGKGVAEDASEAPVDGLAAPSVEAVRTLLLEVMGDASAVHLRTVLAHLQEHGQWEGRTVGDLRAHLEALHIPVHPKVKAPGGGPTRGVRKADLAPSPEATRGTSTEPSTAA